MFYKVGFDWLVKERLATIYWWQFVSADFFAKSLDSWNCCWMHCPASLELATKWAVLITQDVDRHSNSAKKWLLFQTSVMMPHYQMVGSEFKFMRSLKEAIMAKKTQLVALTFHCCFVAPAMWSTNLVECIVFGCVSLILFSECTVCIIPWHSGVVYLSLSGNHEKD